MRINKKYIAIILLICAFVPFIFNVQKVQAAYSYKSGSDVTMDKITKYNASQAIGIFKNSTNISAVKDFLEYGLIGTSKSFVDKNDNCSVPVPNTVMSGTQDKSPTLSCWDFWYGNSNWSALIKGEKSNSDPSNSAAVEYIKPLGYTQDAVSSPGGQKCFKLTWTNPNDTSSSGGAGEFESNTLCADVDSDGYVWGNSLVDGGESQRESSVAQYRLQRDQSGGVLSSTKYEVIIHSGYNYNPVASVTVQDGDNMKKWSTFEQDFRNEVNNMYTAGVTNNLTLQTWSNGSGSVSNQVTDNTTFTRNKGQTVVSYSGDVLLSEAEVYNIYAKYLTNSSKVKLSCDASYDYDSDAYDWVPVQLKRNGKVDSTCHVREISKELYTGGQYLQGTYDPATNTLTNGAYLFNRRNMSLADIAAAVNDMNLEKLEEDIDDFTGATENVSSEDGETEPTCMNTAATSLGWILCPVLDAFGGATDWAYNELVKPALQIEPQLFTGGNEGTQRAWETFRSIANVFFIILFLVVIFSQLTGVGIDNYGIKKILPKLILAAVLINLSYLICIIFVDVSNILGNGLQNMFTDLGSQLSIPDSLEGGIGLSGVAQSTLTSIVVLIALIGGVATAITAAGGVVAFLVSLLIIALSALVALFFLFLLLAAREAAIIVLIVLSPLAFACYILPNTQNTFKKWYQLGWRLLMVYPIAGLLIGGGDFVSKLLLSAGVGGQGFFSAFAAIIAGIIPIFFIPTVLKQAFALMGGLGAKISGLGKSVGGRISGNVGKSIQGSERFKNYQADRERNRKLNFARRTNERLSRRNSETLSDRQRRQLASARMIESAEYAENLKRDAIVDGNRYEAMRAGIRAKDEDQAINDRLALMRSSGESGGIMVGGQKVAYTLDNLNARMQELERKSRSAALSSDEQSEMAALARGMVSQKGGAGMLNNIVRNAGNQDATGKHQLNANFMSSLGQIYNNDSTVASKMTEKDGGMGGYMERFMPGGDGVNRNESFDDYFADNSNNGYAGNASRRIKSHEAGLNQSGEAFRYYLGTLTKDQAQSIMDNQPLLNSLDVDNRTEFISHARTLGVTGPSARDVNVINVPHTP